MQLSSRCGSTIFSTAGCRQLLKRLVGEISNLATSSSERRGERHRSTMASRLPMEDARMTTLPIKYFRAIADADHDRARRFAEIAAAHALANGELAETLIVLIGEACKLILCGRVSDALDVLEAVANTAADAKEARRHG